MDFDTVTDAVNRLRADGQHPTIRAVHALTGGSFRDISKFLAMLPVAGDAKAAGEADMPAPIQRTPGKIQEAVAAVCAAESEVSEAAAALDERRESLQVLREQYPRHATTPADVAGSVEARHEYDEKIATVVDQIQQLERLMRLYQEEATAHRRELAKLQQRRQELEAVFIPSARRTLAGAQQDQAILERDVAHQLQMAPRRVDGQARALAAYQREWQALTGDAREGGA